ncbi:MAG: non-canonical purine NTP pyrophosphatase [Spirochaetales bacterium]
MRVCLASNNEHKKREIAALLGDSDVISPSDLGITFAAEETGVTFLANALIKAKALWTALCAAGVVGKGRDEKPSGVERNGQPLLVLADDSGLCVDALDGRPGVYSAQFGVTEDRLTLSSDEQNALLLAEMNGVLRRDAHFVCCMVAILDDDRIVTAQERWDGVIATDQARSSGGFGYDPIFYLPRLGCTAAELSSRRKNELSHRGRAISVVRAAIMRARELPTA